MKGRESLALKEANGGGGKVKCDKVCGKTGKRMIKEAEGLFRLHQSKKECLGDWKGVQRHTRGKLRKKESMETGRKEKKAKRKRRRQMVHVTTLQNEK